MAMKDLGTMPDKMFDHPSSAEPQKKYYPNCRLPMALIKGLNLSVGDKICFEAEGTIVGINQDKYSNDVTLEFEKGEVEAAAEGKAEAETEAKK